VQRPDRLRAGRDAIWDCNVLELICGACGGRLLVETPGTTVACPHCGTVLEAPLETPPETAGAILTPRDAGPDAAPDAAAETVKMDFGAPSSVPADAAAASEVFPEGEAAPSFYQPIPELATGSSAFAPTGAPTAGVPEFTDGAHVEPVGESPESSAAPFDPVSALKFAQAEGAVPSESAAEAPQAFADQPSLLESFAEPAAGPFDTPSPEFPATAAAGGDRAVISDRAAEASAAAGPSRFVFNLVVSYASAATLVCLYLLWLVYFLRTHSRTLDLPDLVPESANKKVSSLSYLPADKEMPPANVLRLGETRQYGSIAVTPLNVTRGPVEFLYYDPDKGYEREPEGPVLKLHLRFANVSHDQEFIPLDSRLVFTRRPDPKAFGLFVTNNFVCSVAQRGERARHVLAFDLSPDSPWLLNGQHLDRVLRPGQSVETFIATSQENLEALSGELLWRVHFRKGYNPKSFRGVTTLIEVRFKSSDIVDEPPRSEDGKKAEGKDA